MAKYRILQNFYKSDEWLSFRQNIIQERLQKENKIICEYCHKEIKDLSQITLHHYKTELTPENVNDVNISLNPDNTEIVHHDCHNKIHKRFCSYKLEHKVYLVYGPPLSGKTTYVIENMERGDLVIDMDRLYEAVGMQPYYDKPNNLLSNVMGVYNLLLDNIKVRYGKWNNAWIIGGYADKYKRGKIITDIGPEVIFCNVSKEECIRRLEGDYDRRYRKAEWKQYIEKWFEQYQE